MDDPAPPAAATSTAGLREAVLHDDQRHIGVPMLLHTATSLTAAGDHRSFSTAGYLWQADLGRRLLKTGVPDRAGEPVDGRLLTLNFHAIPAAHRAQAAERVRRVVDLGVPYDPDLAVADLAVAVAFYDGDRDTALFAAELCAGLGVRAYFFPVDSTALESGRRVGEADLAAIAAQHELGFHTSTHRAAAEITPANLEREVLDPLDRLTRAAGRPPRLAAWRGGARYDGATLGDQTIREHGVRHLVSNWSVEPVPVDPDA